jgi:hypothetical protein
VSTMQAHANLVMKVMKIPNNDKIDALSAAVPEGGNRTYPALGAPVSSEQRYLYIGTNWEYYKPCLTWANKPGLRRDPAAPIRGVGWRSIFDMPPCELTFDGTVTELADIYPVGRGVAFISEKLKSLFDAHDPAAIRSRSETVKVGGEAVTFYLTEAGRVLRGVNLERSTVQIRDQPLGHLFVRYIEFPEGVTFRDDIDPAICAFWDYDYANWMWSREFIEMCRQAGVRGIRAEKSRADDPGNSITF